MLFLSSLGVPDDESCSPLRKRFRSADRRPYSCVDDTDGVDDDDGDASVDTDVGFRYSGGLNTNAVLM
jgi:hypothetical protein